jgi:hypothetical protein
MRGCPGPPLTPLFVSKRSMHKPSDSWVDFGSWKQYCQSTSWRAKFSAIKFGKLESTISAHRSYIPCRVNTSHYAGRGMNTIFEAVFEEGEVWLCRVGYVGEQYSRDEVLRAMMESTVTAMRYISDHTFIPVPIRYNWRQGLNLSTLKENFN